MIDRLKEVLPEIKETVPSLKRKTASGEMAGPCPFCGGTDRFVVFPDGGAMCRQCEFKGDKIDYHQALESTDVKGLAERYLNGSGFIPGTKPTRNEPKREKAAAIPANLTEYYSYGDEDGNLLFEVCRYEEPGKEKTFRQRRYEGNQIVNNLNGTRRVLYNLPNVRKADTIYFLEGEKDCCRLNDAGLTATTSPMGAAAWKAEYVQFLKGKDVVILPDNDEPGKQYADKVSHDLLPVAASVKIVSLPGLPHKGDVSDWMDNGGSIEEMKRIVAEAPALNVEGKTKKKVDFATLLGVYEVKEEYVKKLGDEQFLYDNLIVKNHIITIIAMSGGGKTTFFFFHVSQKLAKQGLTVWYLDADSPASDHKKMKLFADKNGFRFLNPDANQGTSIESLVKTLRKIADSGADLTGNVFIVDTLKKFADLMSKGAVKEFYKLCRKLTALRATVILLGHANKYRDKDGNLIFEGTGDVRADSDELIFFESAARHGGDGINVTTIVDPAKNAKVRGIFKPFSFHITPSREIEFYDSPLPTINWGAVAADQKATDDEILEAAEKYLAEIGQPVLQRQFADHVADMTNSALKRVKRLIVQHSELKNAKEKEGRRFLYSIGERNAHYYELPPRNPVGQALFENPVEQV